MQCLRIIDPVDGCSSGRQQCSQNVVAYQTHSENSSCNTETRYRASYQLLNTLCASRENHSTQKYFISGIKMK